MMILASQWGHAIFILSDHLYCCRNFGWYSLCGPGFSSHFLWLFQLQWPTEAPLVLSGSCSAWCVTYLELSLAPSSLHWFVANGCGIFLLCCSLKAPDPLSGQCVRTDLQDIAARHSNFSIHFTPELRARARTSILSVFAAHVQAANC